MMPSIQRESVQRPQTESTTQQTKANGFNQTSLSQKDKHNDLKINLSLSLETLQKTAAQSCAEIIRATGEEGGRRVNMKAEFCTAVCADLSGVEINGCVFCVVGQ